MKRTVAVCLMAGLVLAMSTAAFASPVTTTLTSGTVVSDSTVTSGFTNSVPTITWFQPVSTPAQPNATAAPYSLPAGGTYALDLHITGATLTIVANGIANVSGAGPLPERDYVWAGASSSGPTWTAVAPPAYLNPGGATSDSTTVFVVSDPTVLTTLTGAGGTGSYIQVRLSDYPSNVNDTVKSSRLQVTGTYAWTYTYDGSAPAPVVPAPGAILLASMGAGLVSWLRARKSL